MLRPTNHVLDVMAQIEAEDAAGGPPEVADEHEMVHYDRGPAQEPEIVVQQPQVTPDPEPEPEPTGPVLRPLAVNKRLVQFIAENRVDPRVDETLNREDRTTRRANIFYVSDLLCVSA